MNKMNEEPWYSREATVKEYESYYKTKYKRADLLEKQLLIKLLRQFDSVHMLLEVGCGTAHFTRWMESLQLECYGLDVSRNMLREAKKLWVRGQLLQGESGHLPFRPKSVDILSYITSLEYMPNVEAVLVEATRVAKKGIIIGLINKWSPATIRKVIQKRVRRSGHYRTARFFSISDIRQALNRIQNEKHDIVCWSTTVFPRVFNDMDSSLFPFGSFLGIAVRLGDTIE
jgi:ubiquinone/menaquinone biosynthesis C-methylase UbiE